jgi:hypothetical protein
VVRVPQLASDENLLSGNTTILDSLPYFVLITINESSVDMSVPISQRELYSLLNDLGLGFPSS